MKSIEDKKTASLPLRVYWDLLETHIRPQWPRFILVSVLLLTSIGLQLLNPQIMRGFIDDAMAASPLNQLMVSAALFIFIAILQQVVSVGVTYFGESVAWTATNALRGELARHCLSLDMGFHNQHTPGELIERINGDITQMAAFFSQFVITLVGNLLLQVGILVVLFFEDWRAGLAFTIFSVAGLLLLNHVRDIAMNEWKDHRQATADMVGFIEEQLSGTEDMRSSGAAGFVIRQLYALAKVIFRRERKASGKNLIIHVSIDAILTIGLATSIGMGYYLFNAGLVTVGMVYLLIRYISLLEGPFNAMAHEMQSFQSIGACVQRLNELRNLKPLVRDGAGLDLPQRALGLAFEDVSFAYTPEEPVLRGLSFELQPGKALGLLGRTGSGKSTLARLIFRLYDPSSGRIRIEASDLTQTRLPALRSRIAMVTQDVQIFRASVRDNLTFFDRSIPDERILQVIADLGLTDWLRALPKGLDSELESGGRGLSAGEAQLLALARVFLRDPGLVILDEASSRLDPATEQRIERAIDRLLRDRTAIIIAHRLGTVHRADDILILEDGRAGEYGPRAALAADPSSRFYSLLQTGLEEVLV
jgi:ABC-type multidrug transport system fused ATPase/permease subunit